MWKTIDCYSKYEINDKAIIRDKITHDVIPNTVDRDRNVICNIESDSGVYRNVRPVEIARNMNFLEDKEDEEVILDLGHNGRTHGVPRAIDIRYAKTGKVMHFKSMNAASKYLGIETSRIHRRVECGEHCLWEEGVQYRDASDKPWKEPTRIRYPTYKRPVSLTDIETGVTKLFDSLSAVGKYLGTSTGSISVRVTSHRTAPYRGKWDIKLLEPA